MPALDIVAEPLVACGIAPETARDRAARLLARLHIPERLWPLAPATFSGGEQQRIDIARSFVADYPILLLDEPTASLDPANQQIVIELIRTACRRGAAVLGIFHDKLLRNSVAHRVHALSPIEAAASITKQFSPGLIVTRKEVFPGTVIVRGADIAAVKPGDSQVSGTADLGSDYLIPGLVELHTDNLEPHFAPRPGVRWPGYSAMLAHDAQIAASAITTVLDAVALGDIYSGSPRVALMRDMVEIVRNNSAANVTRAEHFLHLRCELSYEGIVGSFVELAPGALVRLVSLMDHTLGQC